MMGIVVSLQTENGNDIASVSDPTNLLHKVLPELDDPRFRFANTIDWYGDTVFNRLQTELLRKEWALLIQHSTDDETRTLLKQIDELLLRCISDVHLYVKFTGD